MKCPKCGQEGCKYITKRKVSDNESHSPLPRTDFKAKCKKCGWTGNV